MADNTIAENRDEGSFIWDNYYDADEKINEYDLTLFIKEQSEDEDDIYKKFEETHFQRCYEISELKELLEQSDRSHSPQNNCRCTFHSPISYPTAAIEVLYPAKPLQSDQCHALSNAP